MASPFENFVNDEVPKRIGFSVVPVGGNATAGKYPRFTGVGLTIEEADAGGALPTNAFGDLHNDGAGALSWVPTYIANHTSFVYTVSNVGGGGQYTNFQDAVDAINATGNVTDLFIVSIFPGIYADVNINCFGGNSILFMSSNVAPLSTHLPDGEGVLFQYSSAPVNGSAYISFGPSATHGQYIAFNGIAFRTTSLTTVSHLFQVPPTVITGNNASISLTNCNTYCFFGNTDSSIIRSDYPASAGGGINVFISKSYMMGSYGGSATGVNGVIGLINMAGNKAASIKIEYSMLYGSMNNSTVFAATLIRCAGTTAACPVSIISCDRLWLVGNTANATATTRLVHTSNNGAITLYACSQLALTGYVIQVVYTDGTTAGAVAVSSCNSGQTAPTSAMWLAYSVTGANVLTLSDCWFQTLSWFSIVGGNTTLANTSSFLNSAGVLANIVPASAYGMGASAGTVPTFAKENHSHGTPPAILYGGSRISVTTTEPVAPAEGDIWVDIN